jgi:hypothetical protein
MSSISFESVSRKSPDLRPTTEALGQWLKEHRERQFIYPASVLHELGHMVNAQQLLRVLAQLVESEQLEMRFRVALPDGTLSEDDFDDPHDVPPVVFDSSFQPVEVSDDRIVTIYQLPHHGR